jgi:hypothetical protein
MLTDAVIPDVDPTVRGVHWIIVAVDAKPPESRIEATDEPTDVVACYR